MKKLHLSPYLPGGRRGLSDVRASRNVYRRRRRQGRRAISPSLRKAALVRTVHTRAHVRLGARVRVNGTRVRVFGLSHRARIHGIVVRRVGGTTFLAAGRSLLASAGPRAGSPRLLRRPVRSSTRTSRSPAER